jgi:hypothetical protein
VIYGAGELIEPSRLLDMADGFGTFSATVDQSTKSLSPPASPSSSSPPPPTGPSAKVLREGADILLGDASPNVLRDTIVDLASDAIGAFAKEQNKRINERIGVGSRFDAFLHLSASEKQSQTLVEGIASRLGASSSTPSAESDPRAQLKNLLDQTRGARNPRELAALLPELRKYSPGASYLTRRILARVAHRIAGDLEAGLAEADSLSDIEKRGLERLRTSALETAKFVESRV